MKAVLVTFIAGALFLAEGTSGLARQAPSAPLPRAAEGTRVTFIEHIAPLVSAHCSTCHRPGGPAPFSLLAYEDVKARARQVADVTGTRLMPPWKPEPGYGEFMNERRLTVEQISLFQQWARQGAVRGDGTELPPQPSSTAGWQLGQPDFIIRMPVPYRIPSTSNGADVFRHFVLPVSIPGKRYVKAWEFKPGNPRVVHHATMLVDSTTSSRHLDEEDPEPGYSGLIAPTAKTPEGYFLGWTPGQMPYVAPSEIAWPIERESDIVLMLHLRPTGKEETVQAELGLFFSDVPPTRTPVMLALGRQNIDIPAGEKNYRLVDSYTLPVDVDLYGIQPHAHYLAREMKAFATRPDGTREWLIYIKEWDFDWQDTYRFAAPVLLPAGTTVVMEYTYDNSSDNPDNPHSPPKRVTYGQRTTDEMGDLWLQVLPRNLADLSILARSSWAKSLPERIMGHEMMLKADPESVSLHNDLALFYVESGKVDRAADHFAESVRIRPDSAAAHYNLGAALLEQGKQNEAVAHFQEALKIKPDYARAHKNLGFALLAQGDLESAVRHYSEAARLEPGNAGALYDLGVALQRQAKLDEAILQYRRALQLKSDDPQAHYALGLALGARGDDARAAEHYRLALQFNPDSPASLSQLARVLATSGDQHVRSPEEALRLAERAVQLTRPPTAAVIDVLAVCLAARGYFERAVAAAELARDLAARAHDNDLVEEIRKRLEVYRQELRSKPRSLDDPRQRTYRVR